MKIFKMEKNINRTFDDAPERILDFAESGFTLLELLIALLIGAIVIAVVGGLFLANTNTFRAVDDTSRLQENGRFALQTIARVTRQAGFAPADVLQRYPEKDDAFSKGALVSGSTARYIFGLDASGPNNSDSLTVAFRPSANGEVVDCTGSQQSIAAVGFNPIAPITGPVVNTFFVAASTPVDATSSNSLFCAQNATGANPIELIRGVESFQVLYAVDLPPPATPAKPNPDRDFIPNYYTSANNLTGGELFNNVTGVQIALVLRGGERSTLDKALTASQSTLNLFGTDVNGAALYTGDPGATYLISSDDVRRTFRVITSTINLRNRSG